MHFSGLTERDIAAPLQSECPVPCRQDLVGAKQAYCSPTELWQALSPVQSDAEEIKISFISIVLCILKCVFHISQTIYRRTSLPIPIKNTAGAVAGTSQMFDNGLITEWRRS